MSARPRHVAKMAPGARHWWPAWRLDLVEADAFANLADAIRLLMWKGYGSLNIAMHADNARQAAMQSVVAREMARS